MRQLFRQGSGIDVFVSKKPGSGGHLDPFINLKLPQLRQFPSLLQVQQSKGQKSQVFVEELIK